MLFDITPTTCRKPVFVYSPDQSSAHENRLLERASVWDGCKTRGSTHITCVPTARTKRHTTAVRNTLFNRRAPGGGGGGRRRAYLYTRFALPRTVRVSQSLRVPQIGFRGSGVIILLKSRAESFDTSSSAASRARAASESRKKRASARCRDSFVSPTSSSRDKTAFSCQAFPEVSRRKHVRRFIIQGRAFWLCNERGNLLIRVRSYHAR